MGWEHRVQNDDFAHLCYSTLMILSPSVLESWTHRLLEASGLSEAHAAAAAEIFTRASLRGLGHHDFSYLPQRLGWLAEEQVNAKPRLELLSEAPAAEVWDGDEGLGEVLCSHVTRRAMELAGRSGVGYAGIRRSNHFLAGDPYTQIGAEQGFLIVVWSNTDAGMAFPGQFHRQIGNNPLGWGLGTGPAGMSADLCLAYSSLGNLNTMAASGTQAPPHWGRGPDGAPTLDPKALLAGAVEPIGGPKGLALALLGEVLTGVLTGGATLDEVAPGGGLRTHNQMVLAFDLNWFGGKGAIEERLTSMKDRARKDGETQRLPGDRSRAAEAKSRAEGISYPQTLEATLKDWSEKLGVATPQI